MYFKISLLVNPVTTSIFFYHYEPGIVSIQWLCAKRSLAFTYLFGQRCMTSASLTQIADKHMNVITTFEALANVSYWTGDQLAAAVPGVPGATAPGGVVSSPSAIADKVLLD